MRLLCNGSGLAALRAAALATLLAASPAAAQRLAATGATPVGASDERRDGMEAPASGTRAELPALGVTSPRLQLVLIGATIGAVAGFAIHLSMVSADDHEDGPVAVAMNGAVIGALVGGVAGALVPIPERMKRPRRWPAR